MEVVWSVKAKESYLTIIDQVFEKWDIQVVEKLESQINDLIDKIVNYNHICPKSNLINLHKCVVNKHIALIYRVSKINQIEIVLLIFNQSEHIF